MRYGLIGAAGYIAPRHMEAIIHGGGALVAACDPNDSVGVLDSYAPNCAFTTEPEEFWDTLIDQAKVDTVVTCAPNYLHLEHALAAVAAGRKAIVEKPMYLPGQTLPRQYDTQVTPIAQLRYIPRLEKFRTMIQVTKRRYQVEILYSTFRGPWYDVSWKSDPKRSGGILLNLGIHLIDLCHWLFGDLVDVEEATVAPREATAHVRFDRADVVWSLDSLGGRQRTMKIDGVPFDLSKGWDRLHLHVYQDHECGLRRCEPEEARQAIATAHEVTQHATR